MKWFGIRSGTRLLLCTGSASTANCSRAASTPDVTANVRLREFKAVAWLSLAMRRRAAGAGEPHDLKNTVWRDLDIVIQSAGPHDRIGLG